MNNLETEINNAFKREVEYCNTLIYFIQGERAKGDEDGFWDRQWHIATEKKLQAQFNIKVDNIPSFIPIKKEPKMFYKELKVYEKCIFCVKETDTWNIETNTPICIECSKTHTILEIKSIIPSQLN